MALLLRLTGINHGFPFIFHPDEPTVIQTSYGINFYLNPGHFDWPHLYMYFNFFVYKGFALFREVFAQLGIREQMQTYMPIIWDQELIFYLITRILSAFIGALTVFPVFSTGKRLFNEKAAIFAALGMALLPFHVWHSHYALIDVPAAFFVACSMYFAAGILKGDNVQDYIGAGFYAGLAASTKYNGGLSLITVPLAHILKVLNNKEKFLKSGALLNLFLTVIFAILAFLIGTPYAILDYKTFIRTDGPKGALWQFTNVGSVELIERIPRFFDVMINKVAENTGYTILSVFFIVLFILIFKSVLRKGSASDSYLCFLLLSGLFFLLYISGFEKSRAHYFMISYPYLAVVFGYFVDQVYVFLESRIKYVSILLFLLVFGFPFYYSSLNAVKFLNSDTRVYLYNWLAENTKPGDSILYNSGEMNSVIEKTGLTGVRSDKLAAGVIPTYIIVAFEGTITDVDFNFGGRRAEFEQKYSIDNEYRLGPKVNIYSLKR